MNQTGRNDLVLMKTTRDKDYIYFYASTREPLSPYTDRNWMMLFIHIPQLDAPDWEGFHFVVNRKLVDEGITLLETCQGGWNWTETARVSYRVEGKELHLAIPRSVIGLGDTAVPAEIHFKWVDNMQSDGDITDLAVNGDCAPNGRFRYVFSER